MVGADVIAVLFVSEESAIHALEGCAVAVRTLDGVEAVGVLHRHVPPDGTQTQVHITAVLGGALILDADIRNFAEIVVP
jgi:hypothetical protein